MSENPRFHPARRRPIRPLAARGRRSLLAAGGAVAVSAALPRPAGAQSGYPDRAVRLIVPFAPGGASDILARHVAKGLTDRWGQPVVVENRAGGSAIIGTDAVAKSPADGHTLLFATISNLAVNPSLFGDRLPYDSLKSFAPLTLAASIPMMLVVHKDLPVNSVQELIRYMREKGPLNYGSGGNGTTQHLAMEMFKTQAGVQATHVPYKGSAPAMLDLVGGQIALMFDNLNTALPHVRSGKLKALAVTTPKRTAQAPDVPTMMEQGLADYAIGTWFAFVAPAGVPEPVVQKISRDMVAVLREPATGETLGKQGMELIASDPAELRRHIGSEIARWAEVIRKANIRVD